MNQMVISIEHHSRMIHLKGTDSKAENQILVSIIPVHCSLMCSMTRSPHRHRQIGKHSRGKDVESEDSHLTCPICPPQPTWGPGSCYTLLPRNGFVYVFIARDKDQLSCHDDETTFP